MLYHQQYSHSGRDRQGQRQAVLFVEDPGYPAFGPAVKPDTFWRMTLTRIFGANQYDWFGPILDPDQNGPALPVMQDYQLVIWNTYDYWWGAPQGFSAGLTAADQVNLHDYLAGGGKVWLIGQDLILSGLPLDWLALNMHLRSAEPDYWHGSRVNLQDRITPHYLQINDRSDYQFNEFWPDGLLPDTYATVVLRDIDHNQNVGIAAPYLPPYQSGFWSMDSRNPQPDYYWEYIVRKMLRSFGLNVPIVDAAVLNIDLAPTVLEHTFWRPQARLKNHGSDSTLVAATCRIEPGGFLTQNTAWLPPDSAQTIVFPDSFLFTRGTFQTTVFTALAGDLDPSNDTALVITEATNWRYYDDGIAANVWAWNDENNGWGVQFPVIADCQVDSIAVFMGSESWPIPGSDTASFRLYSGAARPETMRWRIDRTYIRRGFWNVLAVDTAQTRYSAGDNIFVFYLQVGDLPFCPGLAYDQFINYPQYMWQLYNDSFSISLPGGDWLIRCHLISNTGIQEERRNLNSNSTLQVPFLLEPGSRLTINLSQPAAVKIFLYDITGGRRYDMNPGLLPAGQHHIQFYPSVPSGVYFIWMQTDRGLTETRKTIILR